MAQEKAEVTNAEMAAFCRQFGSLAHAKVNLLDILTALREQSGNALLREIVDSVRDDVEMGRSLATAFSRYPAVCSPFLISMVRQGELEGELDRVFSDLAQHYESRIEDALDPSRRRDGAELHDIQAVASLFNWVFIWTVGLVAACLLGAGLVWYATGARGLPGQPVPNVMLLTGAILLLGVLVFSRGRRRR